MKKIPLLIVILLGFICNSQTIDVTEIELNYVGDSSPQNITKGNTKIYFSADNGIDYEELWVHDMLTNNTYMVKNISSGGDGIDYNSIFLTVGDILYFTTSPSSLGIELWRSDGTESGTYLIKHIGNYGGPSLINSLTYYNGNLFFAAYDTTVGRELWVSDGTPNGTTLFKDIYNGVIGSNPGNFFIFNGNLFFTANNGTNGNELWISDGTDNGTTLFKDIYPGANGGIAQGGFIKMNNSFYFYASDSNSTGYELWKSDGTSNGTVLFKDIIPGANNSNYGLIGASTSSYFIFEVISTNGTELWKCDETVAGTTLLKDIYSGVNSGVSSTTQFAVYNNKIYFDANTATTGVELWGTDGTTVGTELVKDIRTGTTGSFITELTATSNYLVFSARGDDRDYNTVWKSDGTTSGTFELKDTNLTLYSNTNFSFVEFNNLVFFAAGYNSANGIELWSTDGTTANTTVFKDIYHRFSGMTDFYDVAELGNKLIFTGNNGNGNEPFITDGTIIGTQPIKDINPGNSSPFFTSAGFRSASYTKAGNYVFFRAITPNFGAEIWKTDGTEANTTMVKDIKVGLGNSISEYPLFMEFNGIFYFKADDGVHGEELWRSDGTETGTYMLKDINPGNGHAFGNQSNIYYNEPNTLNEKCYAVLNGYLYFAANDGTDSSIWRTDGTQNGTTKVINIPASGVYDNGRVVINASNDKIFFKTNTNNSSYGNNSIWSSDGTQTGTTLLYETNITGIVQFKKNLIHNNNLYFTAYGNNGTTLVKSDGTLNGTVALIENFTDFYTFNTLTSCGNYVYFGVGEQGSYTSKELWRTDGTTPGTVQLGAIPLETPEFFIDCDTCYQDNLIFKKDSQNNEIYYVNGNSTNADNYLTADIVNSENFGEIGYYIYTDFYEFNGKLLFPAAKQYSGTELYSSEFDMTLNTPDFSSETINKIIVYPNPAKNNFSVKVNNDEAIISLKLFDLFGKKIDLIQKSDSNFDISNLSSGIYIITVVTNKSSYNSKLIIKK
ncbi:ELWxxDGT repeat protein [Flavobacterium sp.]|uniref:ELWxxDGT repeat protein n=1 Tax=Flavobacterium sp. TaxID=239 RepID=UPI002B4AC118|nr:ELWxxDGT repeat protein [Flavobacterium sp.]HLP64433.1 ELWxxDGT repeat protein [Flavobacterium sp.]